MKNAITTLRIQNFKSIKDVGIKPRRVNLILGEPNVGKSNVLEAMSLLGGMVYDEKNNKFMNGQIRYDIVDNLFYDNDTAKEIEITGSSNATRVRKREGKFEVVYGDGRERLKFILPTEQLSHSMELLSLAVKNARSQIFLDKHKFVNFEDKNHIKESINSLGAVEITGMSEPVPLVYVRKYEFEKLISRGESYDYGYLKPPYGDNLLDIIRAGKSSFRKELSGFFANFNLQLALRIESRSLEIQKNTDGIITSIPYSLIADTLQRLIFYLAAIESNDDAVLLFEEPEAHSFPTYVAQLGQRIVDSENNQFFIVTHSPYLVTEIFEEMVPKDELLPQLAVFVTYYEDYQTKIRQLTDEEVIQARADGLEMFYNLNRFIPERG